MTQRRTPDRGPIVCVLALMTLFAALVPVTARADEPLSEREAHEIGVEAYIYLYPLVIMDVTRRQMTNVESGRKPGFGPVNAFSHVRAYPSADMKAVVRPNFDTLYSIAWLDLRIEPVFMSVPDTDGRYYLMPLLDMWTDVFAVPGTRTTGTQKSHYAIVPWGWKGQLPKGVARIESPTPYVWIIGRTQTNGPEDYAAVHQIQDGYRLSPFSRVGRKGPPAKVTLDPTVDMKTPPLDQVNAMPAAVYFKYAADLMKVHPPHITDWSILARMKKIGLEPGKSFALDKLAPTVKEGLQKAPAEAQKLMQEKTPTLARQVNGWSMNTDTMGVYGNFYLKRAVVAMIGLGANPPGDAIYPLNVADADGNPLTGEHRYVLHFRKEELPPVNAFWSVTMYDGNGFQVANPINRFAVSSWMPFKFHDDGSLDLYLQHENPGPDRESNWLPAPKGPMSIVMRLYFPKPEALDGRWSPPAVKLVE